MDYTLLEYTKKWFDYGLLNESILQTQLENFNSGEDSNTEHYRYWTFINFIQQKENISTQEIDQFIEIAKEDPFELMAGAAVKELFLSPILNEAQYEYVKVRLPEFGTWTMKLISREDLLKQLHNEEITFELFLKCWEHKTKFKENIHIEIILNETENIQILEFIANSTVSKKFKLQVQRKLFSIQRNKTPN